MDHYLVHYWTHFDELGLIKLSKMALTMPVQCVVVSENCMKNCQKVAKKALNRFLRPQIYSQRT